METMTLLFIIGALVFAVLALAVAGVSILCVNGMIDRVSTLEEKLHKIKQ